MQAQSDAIDANHHSRASFRSDDSRRPTNAPRKATMARAAMAAIEPLVEIFLELGITSPEAESLLRSLFVHKTREWLASQDGGAGPSDVRIALVTGVHRNFVREILAHPPAIAEQRQQKGQRSGRLLEAWHMDPAYLDSGGKPRDLPERGAAPSFEALVSAHVPGAATGVVLRELQRSGVVLLLTDRRVRVRSRSTRVTGMTVGSLTELGQRAKALLETLRHNLRDPQHRLFVESLPSIELDANRVPVVREVINRRATAFLQSWEEELAIDCTTESHGPRKRKTTVSLAVIETKK